MNKYLYWKETIWIEHIKEDFIILYVDYRNESNISIKTQKHVINNVAFEIITLIDGSKTLNDVINFLSSKYNEEYKSIENKVAVFIESIKTVANINLYTCDKSIEKKTEIREGNIYPKVASIELTDKCNIKCLHCYGDFENLNLNSMPLISIKKLLKDLKDLGIYIIELTGGECLTHPNFKEILEYSLSLNFSKVIILTNGLSLSNELFEILELNKENVIIQIDLHSLNEDYLTWFTQVHNTVEIIKKNIIKLAEKNIPTRVATIVTKKNLNEMQRIASWIFKLGVKSFAPSIVINLGRSLTSDKDIFLDSEDLVITFNDNVLLIKKEYPGLIQEVAEPISNIGNCGCISSHVTIDSSGNIKICTMDNLDYFGSRFGNVFEENIKTMYDRNQEDIYEVCNFSAPLYNSDECKDCKHSTFCSGCLLRSFIRAKELKNNCNWYKNKISQNMKIRFSI